MLRAVRLCASAWPATARQRQHVGVRAQVDAKASSVLRVGSTQLAHGIDGGGRVHGIAHVFITVVMGDQEQLCTPASAV